MGVTVETLKKGNGKSYPKPEDQVTMHYTGTLEDGTKFDSSVDRGEPFQFTVGVGQVIKGWDEGVPQMSLGEKAKLTITGDYAYGTGSDRLDEDFSDTDYNQVIEVSPDSSHRIQH